MSYTYETPYVIVEATTERADIITHCASLEHAKMIAQGLKDIKRHPEYFVYCHGVCVHRAGEHHDYTH